MHSRKKEKLNRQIEIREKYASRYLHWSNINYLKFIFMQVTILEVLSNLHTINHRGKKLSFMKSALSLKKAHGEGQ